jgi:F-type H+-transporting ATPase subunit delta
MNMTTKQAKREARQLFRVCLLNGTLDEDRVRESLRTVIQLRRRGYWTVLGFFCRLVKLDRIQHTARIESAEPVPDDVRIRVQVNLERAYGQGLVTQFVLNPELIGGMRVRVGSDVIDRSVQAGIAELKRRFGIASQNGRGPKIAEVLSQGS